MSEGNPPCKNFDDEGVGPDGKGCKKQSDPRYTMDFTDVEPGAYIYWCADCGPEAHELDAALTLALNTRPGFAEQLSEEIDKAKRERNQ